MSWNINTPNDVIDHFGEESREKMSVESPCIPL